MLDHWVSTGRVLGAGATGAWQDQCIEELSIDTGGQKVLSVGKARNLVIHWMG